MSLIIGNWRNPSAEEGRGGLLRSRRAESEWISDFKALSFRSSHVGSVYQIKVALEIIESVSNLVRYFTAKTRIFNECY